MDPISFGPLGPWTLAWGIIDPWSLGPLAPQFDPWNLGPPSPHITLWACAISLSARVIVFGACASNFAACPINFGACRINFGASPINFRRMLDQFWTHVRSMSERVRSIMSDQFLEHVRSVLENVRTTGLRHPGEGGWTPPPPWARKVQDKD